MGARLVSSHQVAIFKVGSRTDKPDDLLQCDCIDPKPLKEKDVNTSSSTGESDDEDERKGFVSATAYNPGPVSCKRACCRWTELMFRLLR